MMEFENNQKIWPTLEEALAKKEWKEDDITVLCANLDELDEKTLARLGVKKPVLE
jgi:hypothetical protein